MSSELRRLARPRALKFGQIFHAPNGTYYDCRLCDLTSTGAKIRFDKINLIGDTIELLIKPENIKVLGRVAWRSAEFFGVEFDRPLNWLKKHDTKPAR